MVGVRSTKVPPPEVHHAGDGDEPDEPGERPGERGDASQEEPVDRRALGRVERLSGDADRPCVRQDRGAQGNDGGGADIANASFTRMETLMSTRARSNVIARSTTYHVNQLRCTLVLVERTVARTSLAMMSTRQIPTAHAIACSQPPRNPALGPSPRTA